MASYVLVTGGLRPSYFVFDVFDGMDGRINRLGIEAGKEMTIYFDIDAHEYQGKWFNTIRAYDARSEEGGLTYGDDERTAIRQPA